MWKSTKIRVSPGMLVTLAMALLVGAGEVLPLVLVAALCHELGHLAVLWLYHVPVEALTITHMGAVIQAPLQNRLSYGQELTATLAGVAVNFVLAFLFARVTGDYLFAGANMILGVYNLLPIQGLDGGRALYLAVAWATEPFTAQRVCHLVNLVFLALLLALVTGIVWQTGGGFLWLMGVVAMAVTQVLRTAGKGGNWGVAKRRKSRYNT